MRKGRRSVHMALLVIGIIWLPVVCGEPVAAAVEQLVDATTEANELRPLTARPTSQTNAQGASARRPMMSRGYPGGFPKTNIVPIAPKSIVGAVIPLRSTSLNPLTWGGDKSPSTSTLRPDQHSQQQQQQHHFEDPPKSIEEDTPVHYRLADYLLSRYDRKLLPRRYGPVTVRFSMELYQIIQVNEPQQYVLLNAWIVERWTDDFLRWLPEEFDNVSQILLPHDQVWMPDTTLYNSLVMEDGTTRRLLNAKITTNGSTSLVELLYPTIYKFSCMLDLRFFPFDVQDCKMLFGSWTFDKTNIDYYPHNEQRAVGTSNCLENEGWNILGTRVERLENKYECCPNNYTLLEFHLYIQRKPLYYVINLITPTSIITLISIIGFFSSSSMNDVREEKISLGITTLLSMSILIFMVSDKMPSTSSIVPLIGWFYTCMISIISLSTLAASVVVFVQKQGILGKLPSQRTIRWARWLGRCVRMQLPLSMKEAYIAKAQEEKMRRRLHGNRKESLWQRFASRTTPKMQSPFAALATAATPALPRNAVPRGGNAAVSASPPNDDNNVTGNGLLADEMSSIAANDVDNEPPSPYRRSPFAKASSVTFDESIIRHDVGVTPTPRTQRNLAELEYDWLAAVIERLLLIVFLILFLFMSIGINAIGMYYWYFATVPPPSST